MNEVSVYYVYVRGTKATKLHSAGLKRIGLRDIA